MLPSDLDWATINRRFGASCPAVLHLVDLVLSLPATSAEAECAFSQLKLIKSDRRNRMNTQSLSDQLIVVQLVLESPEIAHFNPTPAIHLWNTGGSRSKRPHGSRSSKVISETIAGSCSDSETHSDCCDSSESEKVESAARVSASDCF